MLSKINWYDKMLEIVANRLSKHDGKAKERSIADNEVSPTGMPSNRGERHVDQPHGLEANESPVVFLVTGGGLKPLLLPLPVIHGSVLAVAGVIVPSPPPKDSPPPPADPLDPLLKPL